MSLKYKKWNIIAVIFLGIVIAVNMCILVYNPAGRNAKKETKAEKTIIRVWTKDRHDAEFWLRKIEAYNSTNTDGILVRYEIFSDNYASVVENALNTVNAPDLMVYTQQIFTSREDKYADIIPFMDEDFYRTFSPVMIDGLNVIDGKCYYIPTAATTCRLFYNKTLLAQAGIMTPPETMEEVIETARVITQKFSHQGKYGFAINLKNTSSALDRSIMKQGNIELGLKVGYDFSKAQFDFTSYQGLIEKWRTLLSSDCSYPNCESLDIDPLRKLFADGKIAMYMSYTHAELGAYMNQYDMKDEWGVAALPTEYGIQKGVQNYNLNNGYLFNKSSENLEKAWLVYRTIFADTQNLKEYYNQGLGITVVPDIMESVSDNTVLQKNPQLLIGEQEKNWPLSPIESKRSVINIKGLNQYEVFKNLMLGDGDIQGELEDLSERYNEAYRMAVSAGLVSYIGKEDFNPMNPSAEIRGE